MTFSTKIIYLLASRSDEISIRMIAKLFPQRMMRHTGVWSLSETIVANPLFCLSFDCDTPLDAGAAIEVTGRLKPMGIRPSLAVPGELLQQNLKEYAQLREEGAEFLNHGYREHTVWDEGLGRNVSTFFYDQATPNEVAEDVRKGHEVVTEFLGHPPKGFRTPHFGTYQARRQLGHLYQVLGGLGYRYSSSTMPWVGLHRGPVFEAQSGLYEIPVTGTSKAPARLHDSWSYTQSPKRRGSMKDYLSDTLQFVEFVKKHKWTGLVNWYVDPAHVVDSPEFYEAMRAMTEVFKPVTFGELLDLVSPQNGAKASV